MHIISLHPDCPPELASGLSEASTLNDTLETLRPLAYHCDCLVSIAKCKHSGQQVVVKNYIKDRLSSVSRQQVDTETQIHSSLSHDHVVKLLASAEDSRCIYLIVAWAEGGDLRQHMPGMSERRLRDFIIIPLLQTLVLLEQQGIVHRDLKPDNVLVHQGNVLLADFGLAVYTEHAAGGADDSEDSSHSALCTGAEDSLPSHPLLPSASCASSMSESYASSGLQAVCGHDCSYSGSEEGEDGEEGRRAYRKRLRLLAEQSAMRRPASSPELLAGAGGTPLYTAPEVLLAKFQNREVGDVVGHKNDVWALGVMAVEALTGDHPFSQECNVLYSIAHHTKIRLPQHLSCECADFLSAALQRDPAKRPGATELLQHPWLTTAAAAAGIPCTRIHSMSGTGVREAVGSPCGGSSPRGGSPRTMDAYMATALATARITSSDSAGAVATCKAIAAGVREHGMVGARHAFMEQESWEY